MDRRNGSELFFDPFFDLVASLVFNLLRCKATWRLEVTRGIWLLTVVCVSVPLSM